MDPEERLSCNVLDHPWFDGVDLEGIRNRSVESPVDPDVVGAEGYGSKMDRSTMASESRSVSSGGGGGMWSEDMLMQLNAAF